jgi:hypothetical protein
MPRVSESALVLKIQDISDVLTMLNAAELPFTTQVKKGKAPTDTLFHWPVDKYDSASNTGVGFGVDVTNYVNTQKDRGELAGRVMKQWRNPFVDQAAQEIAKQAGDENDKFAQARAKTTVELKQDMEYVLLGQQDSKVDEGEQSPARTRGMACWTNAALQTVDTSYVVPSAFRPASDQVYTGAFASYTEISLRDQLKARWDTVRNQGSLVAFCSSNFKAKVSDFSKYDTVPGGKTAIRNFDGKSNMLESSVDIYKGDFGQVTFLLDAFVTGTNNAEIVDMNKVEIRPTLMPRFRELEDKGGGRRGTNETIYGLQNWLPASHITVQPGS